MPFSLVTSRHLFVALAVVSGTCISVAAPATAAEDELVLAFIPQENPEKLISDIEVIADYLSEELAVPVSGFVTSDHAAAVEALRNGDADISFMGALPFVIAREEIGAEPLLAEIYRGKATYTARIFVRRDSGIETLVDLEGKSIAFADPISESGYLYPLNLFYEADLIESGADPASFFSEVFFSGGYQQSVQAVAYGLVDAAGSSEYADLLLTPEQQAEILWIAESEPIPSHTVIARPGLPEAVKEGFIAAMLELNEPDKRHLLAHVYNPDGYERADPARYDAVAQLAHARGVM